MSALRRTAVLGCVAVAAGLTVPLTPSPAQSMTPSVAPSAAPATRACPPAARARGYSDALDKLKVGGVTLGGLSNLAWDARKGAFAATVDNNDTDPSRVWFIRHPARPSVTGKPLVLRKPDGTPYDGVSADNEGLAILPNGRFVVSSEVEPSIRIFGRDGVQRDELPVPTRLHVPPTGQATPNATLEGLTLTPSGNRLVAAMEGTLSSDVGGSVDTYRRFLVYDRDAHGRFALTKQIGYRVQPGNRVAEVQAYRENRLLVLEAAFSPTTGNSIQIYAVRRVGTSADISGVANLSAAPAGSILGKRLISDVTSCPTLGAPSAEPQTNPLMDNFEAMAIVGEGAKHVQINLVSDDNFNALQKTRMLRLGAQLP